ncbi:glycosyltransferase [uncultured Parabacteroides sp.]|uniref:glycosyltransferase n=1 Tax=uncultured Parabacteroides sp. TaxID=512312 RepID=UPI00262BE059|nr:glycosyltransferase [uncultured Parabacteroides sp.]
MKRKKLLIIDKHQFGDLTDSFKWCEYLKNKYDITIVTLCSGEKKDITMEGVNIVCAKSSNRILRGLMFTLLAILYLILSKKVVLVVFYKGCTIYKKLFPWKKMILDIRTLAVNKDAKIRNTYDVKIKDACEVYDYVTIISKGLAKKLDLLSSHYSILPLGADSLSDLPKTYNDMRLLYVGTLSGRNIDESIKGVALFANKYPSISFSYDIVGDGTEGELEMLKQMVQECGLESVVTLHGRKSYDELKPFFDRCNVGISYIPCTDYYDYQPPTKTFEYVLSGLYCIATATLSNKELITHDNGILINSTSESFAEALNTVSSILPQLDEKIIRESLSTYTWRNIIEQYLEPIINKYI